MMTASIGKVGKAGIMVAVIGLSACVTRAQAVSPAPVGGTTTAFPTITACGNVYGSVQLGSDLSTAKGDCLMVRASGITIEGNGHRISAPGFAMSLVDQSNVTLRNVISSRGAQIYGAKANGNTIESCTLGPVGIYMGDDNTVRNSKLTALGIQGLYNEPPLRTVVTGNVIEGPSGELVYLSPGGDGACVRSDSLIENNFIHGTGTDPNANDQALLYLRCGTHNTIKGNTIGASGTGKARGIYMRDEADSNLIEGNYVWVNKGDRGAFHFSSGNADKHHPRDNVIHGNVFGAGATRSIYIQSRDFRNNTFANNVFSSNALEAGRIAGGTDNVFDHNTFVQGAPGTLLVLEAFSAPGNVYTSNILSTPGKSFLGFSGANDLHGYRGDYNVYFWNWGTAGPQGAMAYWQWATGGEQHTIAANPMFVNPSAGDFRLQPGSPALQAGAGGSPAGALGSSS